MVVSSASREGNGLQNEQSLGSRLETLQVGKKNGGEVAEMVADGERKFFLRMVYSSCTTWDGVVAGALSVHETLVQISLLFDAQLRKVVQCAVLKNEISNGGT
eukprot:3409984-Pyramimonas_sp.AAC.2